MNEFNLVKNAVLDILEEHRLPYSEERNEEIIKTCEKRIDFCDCSQWNIFFGCMECKSYIREEIT